MNTMIKPTHTYIGRCKQCRAILGSVYDMADAPKETGKAVSEMIAHNLEVERVPLASLAGQSWQCTCTPAEKEVAGLPLFEEAAQ